MSGPIVRTGATPKFSENWERVFGNKSAKGEESMATCKGASGAKAGCGKKAAAKKTTRKCGSKSSAKK